jgi:hypothetical protein
VWRWIIFLKFTTKSKNFSWKELCRVPRGVKVEFLLQKVEILVRESCVEVDKFARLTPTQVVD